MQIAHDDVRALNSWQVFIFKITLLRLIYSAGKKFSTVQNQNCNVIYYTGRCKHLRLK